MSAAEMNQPCPLCQRDSTFEMCAEPWGKRFSCPECTEFFIDSATEEYITSANTGVRETAAKKAKATPPGKLLVLREPRSDELGGDGHGVARTTMIGEYVPS